MKSVKISGKKIAELGAMGRLYILLPEVGRTFIPKEHGLKAGESLSGTCTIEEKTYEMESDGVTKRATPLVRWELVDFTSFNAQKETALAELEIASIPTLQLDASYFAKAFSGAVLSA